MDAQEARLACNKINDLKQDKEKYADYLLNNLLYQSIESLIEAAVSKGEYSICHTFDTETYIGCHDKHLIKNTIKQIKELYEGKYYKVSHSIFNSYDRGWRYSVFEFQITIEW